MGKRALMNKKIRRNAKKFNKAKVREERVRANEEKKKVEAEELEKRKQEAASEVMKRKLNATEQIKEHMELHGYILSAIELSKLASLSLLMSSLYIMANAHDNKLLYLLTLAAILFVVLFNVAKVDMESTIYNY